jgi:hypothetical protein
MGLSFGWQYLILSDKHPLIQGRSKKKKSRGVKLNNITGRIFFLRLCFKGEAENFRRGLEKIFLAGAGASVSPPVSVTALIRLFFPKKNG